MVKNLPQIQKTSVRSLGWEDPLEKGMATSSSIVAWSNPWTEAWQATVHGVGKWSDVTEHLTNTLTKRKQKHLWHTHTKIYQKWLSLLGLAGQKEEVRVFRTWNLGKVVP